MKPRIKKSWWVDWALTGVAFSVWECALGKTYADRRRQITGRGFTPQLAYEEWKRKLQK